MNLLCSSALAVNPFVIPELNLKIYSGEELCYFIYHNPALIPEPLLGDPLLAFVEEELGLAAAAARLARFRSSGDPVVQVMAVLREFAYYPEKVLRQFQKTYESWRRREPFVRQIDRGDALLAQGRFQAALQVYRALEEAGESVAGRTEETLAHIWSRMAAADCGLGLYRRALECLREAYRLRPQERTARFAFKLCLLAGMDPAECSLPVSSEEETRWTQEYEEQQRQVLLEEETGELTAICALDSIRREKALTDYVRRRQDAYRKSAQLR